MTPQHQQAANLLTVIWRGIPADYKSRYRMTIWSQFENEVRSAAYTTNLGKFIERLCLKLQASPGQNDSDRAEMDALLRAADGRALLKLLRDETTLIVLMVRVANQERRDRWKAAQPAVEDKKEEGG